MVLTNYRMYLDEYLKVYIYVKYWICANAFIDWLDFGYKISVCRLFKVITVLSNHCCGVNGLIFSYNVCCILTLDYCVNLIQGNWRSCSSCLLNWISLRPPFNLKGPNSLLVSLDLFYAVWMFSVFFPSGKSRASMIPLKQPRNMKASNDTLASIEIEGLAEQPAPKATPPPLPKKAVPRSSTEPILGGKEPVGGLRPRAEAKPGGTNLSVANPLYDLDSTWETASQSSSLSSEPHRGHDHESGDSLERSSAATATNKARMTNSVSSLVPQPSPAASSATPGKEKRVYPSSESLAGRGRTAGRGAAGGGAASKPQRPALYRGLDSWDEVVGRIRGLHTDTLRKLAAKCEDRFMAGQKDHLRFGTESWSHFRLTTGKPCCEAGDAVYYTASYAKDPLVNYAIKVRFFLLVWC